MNKKNYKELKTSFERLETSFDQLAEFVAEKFSKLVDLIGDMRADIEDLKENKADKADVRQILEMLDAQGKKTETYFQEHKMLGRKVDRHEGWINKIAKETDVKLDY